MVTIDPRTPALMLTQNQFQGKAMIQIPHSSTTLLLTAMASCVHRMKIIASSRVLCAQSDLHTYIHVHVCHTLYPIAAE